MFVVTEADAAAIRAGFAMRGEFSAAVELRRRFAGIPDDAQARECAHTIAGWKPRPLRLMKCMPRVRGYGNAPGRLPALPQSRPARAVFSHVERAPRSPTRPARRPTPAPRFHPLFSLFRRGENLRRWRPPKRRRIAPVRHANERHKHALATLVRLDPGADFATDHSRPPVSPNCHARVVPFFSVNLAGQSGGNIRKCGGVTIK